MKKAVITTLKRSTRVIKNPLLVITKIGEYGIFNFVPDKYYLRFFHLAKTGETLNLDDPKTYNEKLEWLKIYDRNPIYNILTDKYKVRNVIADRIGEEYLIPLLGVWDSFDQIEFNDLPDKFVLKCTHDSGSTFVFDKDLNPNMKKLEKMYKKKMKYNYYNKSREWNYNNIKPRIIAEKYMVDESGVELKDYKLFVFGGEVKFIQVDFGRFTNHRRNFYTPEWKPIPMQAKVKNDYSVEIVKPKKLEEMISLAEKLSDSIPHVRVDFYSIDNRIYFGELTFHHGGGQEKFTPKTKDIEMGSWINTLGAKG